MDVNRFEFFINKVIGWALREYAKTDSKWVKQFVQDRQTQLHPLSVRGIKKFIKSIRIC